MECLLTPAGDMSHCHIQKGKDACASARQVINVVMPT
jgi:hypothetical protein